MIVAINNERLWQIIKTKKKSIQDENVNEEFAN